MERRSEGEDGGDGEAEERGVIFSADYMGKSKLIPDPTCMIAIQQFICPSLYVLFPLLSSPPFLLLLLRFPLPLTVISDTMRVRTARFSTQPPWHSTSYRRRSNLV